MASTNFAAKKLRNSARANRNKAMEQRVLFEIEPNKIEEHLRRGYGIKAKVVDYRGWGYSLKGPRD